MRSFLLATTALTVLGAGTVSAAAGAASATTMDPSPTAAEPSATVVAPSATLVDPSATVVEPRGLSAQDSAFVMAAGYAGSFEVAAGALAKARADAAGVRAFGARMISDHNKAGAALARLAQQEGGTTIPSLPDSAQQNIIAAFSRLNGVTFDCAYVPTEYMDHVAAVGLFETEAEHGDNAVIRRFAAETLPTLREHRTMISRELLALDCSEA